MIKTEIEQTDDYKPEAAVTMSSKSRLIYAIAAVVVGIFAVGGLIFLSINRTGVNRLPSNPAKYSSLSALPLGSPSTTGVVAKPSNQTSDQQSPQDAQSLGSSYTGLQNVPQGKTTPTPSQLQSGGQSTSTGQSINPALPY